MRPEFGRSRRAPRRAGGLPAATGRDCIPLRVAPSFRRLYHVPRALLQALEAAVMLRLFPKFGQSMLRRITSFGNGALASQVTKAAPVRTLIDSRASQTMDRTSKRRGRCPD